MASAKEALAAFAPQYQEARATGLCRKLGLATDQPDNVGLAENLLECMAANQADFTLTFRRLCEAAAGCEGDSKVRTLFADPAVYNAWSVQWRARMDREAISKKARAVAMRYVNPAYIPRNHLVQAALHAAVTHQDFQPFEDLLQVTTHPYDGQPEKEYYAVPARPEECVRETFCGT